MARNCGLLFVLDIATDLERGRPQGYLAKPIAGLSSANLSPLRTICERPLLD